MRVRVEGPASFSRPTIVFVHGAGGSATIWLELFRHFERSHQVLAVDLPGHGQSEPWHDVPDAQRIAQYAEAVQLACAEAKVARALVVGHSMGGLVALQMAAAYPDLVAGLCLIASAPGLKPSAAMLTMLTERREDQADLMGTLGWSKATSPDLVERWSKTVVASGPDVTLLGFRACLAFDAATVSVPTLLLGGEDDQLCSPRFLAKGAAKIPGAKLELLPDVGHFVHLERPDSSIAAIERFLPFV